MRTVPEESSCLNSLDIALEDGRGLAAPEFVTLSEVQTIAEEPPNPKHAFSNF